MAIRMTIVMQDGTRIAKPLLLEPLGAHVALVDRYLTEAHVVTVGDRVTFYSPAAVLKVEVEHNVQP